MCLCGSLILVVEIMLLLGVTLTILSSGELAHALPLSINIWFKVKNSIWMKVKNNNVFKISGQKLFFSNQFEHAVLHMDRTSLEKKAQAFT